MKYRQLALAAFVLIVFALSSIQIHAQTSSNFKLGIEAGVVLFRVNPDMNYGLLFNVEPKIRVSENMFVGMRIGLALNPHKFEEVDSRQYFIGDSFDDPILSFVPSVDYFFNGKFSGFYIGGGAGAYIWPKSFVAVIGNSPDASLKAKAKEQLGILLRGGFEWKNFRIGFEYNYISRTDIVIPNDELIATADGRYYGLTFGYILGLD